MRAIDRDIRVAQSDFGPIDFREYKDHVVTPIWNSEPVREIRIAFCLEQLGIGRIPIIARCACRISAGIASVGAPIVPQGIRVNGATRMDKNRRKRTGGRRMVDCGGSGFRGLRLARSGMWFQATAMSMGFKTKLPPEVTLLR